MDRPDVPSEPRAELLRLLRYRGALSLDELSERLGLSKTATRAHALRLEGAGLIRRARPPSTGPGRPPLRYELTPAGADTFPHHEPELLRRLLTFLLERGQRESVEAFFHQVWDARRERFERTHGELPPTGDPLARRLAALEQVLAEDGFMPRLDTERKEGRKLVVVRECNCPLPEALRATRIPCELETRFLADATGGTVERVALATDRTETCDFRLQVESP